MRSDLQPDIVSSSASLPTGQVEYGVWLSGRLLLAVGWFHGDDGGPVEAELLDGTAQDRVVGVLAVQAPQAAPTPSGWLRLVLCAFSSGQWEGSPKPLATLRLCRAGVSVHLELPEPSDVLRDLQPVLREVLAGLTREDRTRTLGLLVGSSAAHHGLRLSHSLAGARAALRERLPQRALTPDFPNALHIDVLLGLDPSSYYIEGWLRDEESPVARLTAVSPEGCRAELAHDMFRYPRPDVDDFYKTAVTGLDVDHGFIAYFTIDAPSQLLDGWTVEMVTEVGEALEADAPSVRRDPAAARETILKDLLLERLPDDHLRRHHIRPAMTCLEERRRQPVRVTSVDHHGDPPSDPEVSIVVPLYRRTDFLEHQLAQFVHDPEIAGADLIYVLDSPELSDALRGAAARLHQLYPGVPFRVVALNRNAGFSGANNIGTSLGRGRLLLLLNSDVLPDRPGWLARLTAFYDETDRIGALAPKLLYEDDSLQHAGLYFTRLPAEGLWTNEHYYKGLHGTLPAANVARPVPAVTAACMLIDTQLYRNMGGLRGIYVQGDYEDTDLCLRLYQEGLDSWYLPDVQLYHLEGQSYPSAMRQLTGAYNRWLYSAEWDSVIEHLMAQHHKVGDPCR